MKNTVLVVDDHAGFRTGARNLLEAEGFQVVGEASDAASAIAAVRTLAPDVVLLDVRLPDVDGMKASKQMAVNGAPAIVLTSSRDLSDLGGPDALAESPAIGFIPKAELSGDAIRALLAPGSESGSGGPVRQV
jgi:DNA-binding NarL/FixJ family response regulator